MCVREIAIACAPLRDEQVEVVSNFIEGYETLESFLLDTEIFFLAPTDF